MTSLKSVAENVINVGTGAYHIGVNYYSFTAPALKLAWRNREMWFSHFAKLHNGNWATEKQYTTHNKHAVTNSPV